MSATASEYRHIWAPLTIGSVTVKHRIMMTAMTTLYGEDHILSDRHIAFYRERARGGVALMITEQQGAYRFMKGSFYRGCSAWDERTIPQFAKLADAVHEFGARMFAQLAGWGVHDKGMMVIDEWHPLWAPSRVPSVLHNETPLVMDQDHINDMVEGFGRSAAHVQMAGLDGVEIHAAHSYALGQFLSPAYNKRTDRYGGSVRKRCHLVLEIFEEIRRRVGRDFTVGIRLSYDEFLGEAGITPEHTEEQLETFAASGLFDFFNISGGGYHTIARAAATMTLPRGLFLPFAKRAKAIVGDRAKVFAVGPRIIDLAMADQALAEGAVDMVGMTRALLADPFLVAKALSGREREIIKCIGVGECYGRNFDNLEVICMMNPVAGRERQWGHGSLRMVGPGAAKRIVTVGGGVAGMKTAAVAARRGHRVVLWEREPELGGHINLLKQLPTRAEWGVAIENLAREMEASGVEVRVGVTATRDLLLAEDLDAVVCATGASYDTTGFSPYRPDREVLPGAHQPNVTDVATATRRALQDPTALGKKVVILDETTMYLPVGLAEILATNGGVDVEIITPHLYVGEDIRRNAEIAHVFHRVLEGGVRFTAQHFVERIDGDVIEVYNIWGGARRKIAGVSTLVLSMMRIPNDALYHELRGRVRELHRVGDALAPRKPAALIYEGEELGRVL
jgi:2,4-dienoyl-CoA reductase-like NADH-dependent reductase (Old Yellow Enzyme family)